MEIISVGYGAAKHMPTEGRLPACGAKGQGITASSAGDALVYREGTVEDVTCKRCQNSAAFQEASQPEVEEEASQPEAGVQDLPDSTLLTAFANSCMNIQVVGGPRKASQELLDQNTQFHFEIMRRMA